MKTRIIIPALFLAIFSVISSALCQTLMLERYQIVFPFITEEDLDLGYKDLRAAGERDLSVRAEAPDRQEWVLTLRAEQVCFMPAALQKSHTDLLWKLSEEPAASFRPLSMQPVEAARGRAAQTVNIDLRLKLGWDDKPADYMLDIIFELKTVNPDL